MSSPSKSLPSIVTMHLQRDLCRNAMEFCQKDLHLLNQSPRGDPNRSPSKRFVFLSPKKSPSVAGIKMSVTEPADSGSGPKAQQTLQVCEQQVQDLNEIGSWAQLMEEEEFNSFGFGDENAGEDEVDGGADSISPERRRQIPEDPPFRVQITNISSQHVDEELLYYFGGDEHVKSVDFRKEDGNADFEFHTKEGLLEALKKHNQEFKGKVLKVFVRRLAPAKVASRVSSRDYSRPYESTDSHFNRRRREDSFRGGSHYNSQSSLNSDGHGKYGRHEKGNRHNYPNNHYGTMPAGGYHDRRGAGEFSGNRGGYHNNNGGNYSHDGHRNSFRAPRNPPQFDRQYSNQSTNSSYHNRYDDNQHGGPLQRSGSYQQQRYSRNSEQFSRASSRMSINEEKPEKSAEKVEKRVSTNPFGDAKPVDTQTKLLEMEQREAAEKSKKKSSTTMTSSSTSSLKLDADVGVGDHEAGAGGEGSTVTPATIRYGGYAQRGAHHHHHHYQQRFQHQNHQNQQNYDQGAPPGSVVIKKRESIELERVVKEDEVPPADPIHYPPQDAKKTSTASEVSSSTDALPPAPPPSHHHNQSYHHHRGARGGSRPSIKPYNPRGAHQHHQNLQKSATIGNIPSSSSSTEQNSKKSPKNAPEKAGKPSEADDVIASESMTSSVSTKSLSRRGGGYRRASLSSTESGAQRGGATGKRGGASRGGARGGGANVRKTFSAENEPKSGEKKEQHEEPSNKQSGEEPKAEAENREIVKKEAERSASEGSKPSEGGDGSQSALTPKKKKEKKKEKKEKAQQNQLGANKFAALMNANE